MNQHLKPALIGISLAIAFAAAFAVSDRSPVSALVVSAHAAADAAQDGKKERKILYYRNPMGLPDTSPVPKKDSMGMDYVPVYEDDSPDDAGVVKVSPARMQTLGVRTASAKFQVLDAAVRAVGRVEIDERATYDVAPRFEGWIERLYLNATGDPVKRGQPLFSVYSPELVSAQKELQVARELTLDAPQADPAAREAAKRLERAARERLANWQVAVPDGKVSSRITFRSPASGIVLEKKAVEGMRFMPGMTIFRIADLSSVWVTADVYEQDLSRIRVGEPGKVMIDAFPGQTFDAKVTYVYPTLNESTRTTPIRLELPNREGLLRPGMFAHVELSVSSAEPRLTVPKSAVIDTGERQVVLLVEGEGRFKPQPVKLGQRGRDDIEILDGLEDGAEVVVAANFLIDAESNLMSALSTFSEPSATADKFKTYSAMGSLDSIDFAAGTVSVNHEPIADLSWPAMTMEFGVANDEVARNVPPGEAIHFTFEDRGDGEFVITRIERMPAGAGASHTGKGH